MPPVSAANRSNVPSHCQYLGINVPHSRGETHPIFINGPEQRATLSRQGVVEKRPVFRPDGYSPSEFVVSVSETARVRLLPR